MSTKEDNRIVDKLVRAVNPLSDSSDMHTALIFYLVGCAVSLLQKRTVERRREVIGLLRELVEKQTQDLEKS